jgi:cyclic pyranopterin monophosphate synthase
MAGQEFPGAVSRHNSVYSGNDEGIRMRDISHKTSTFRTATAEAILRIQPATIAAIRENRMPKGDPLPVARVAAIQAAKQTSAIIPFCHPIPIDHADCRLELRDDQIVITTSVHAVHKTGVEMEALTAASVAALTLYDMAKPVDETMEILSIRLVKKTGGKSDFVPRPGRTIRAAVLVCSDSVSAGTREDTSGLLIRDRLNSLGVVVEMYEIISDDAEGIIRTVRRYADELKLDLVITTGGTGLGPRDAVPEAMSRIIEKEIPGIAEAARSHGQQRMPYAMLSRSVAGLRGRTVILSLPGSLRGTGESLDALFPSLLHLFRMMDGGGH